MTSRPEPTRTLMLPLSTLTFTVPGRDGSLKGTVTWLAGAGCGCLRGMRGLAARSRASHDGAAGGDDGAGPVRQHRPMAAACTS